MRKIAIILLMLFLAFKINAQVSNYTFAQTNVAYSGIVGGTVLGTTNIDDEVFLTNTSGCACGQTAAGFPIGFNFTYNGSTYTEFGVSTNGYITLGNLPSFTMNSIGYFQNINGVGDANMIAIENNDLQGQTGSELSYLTSGASPNRMLTVQWSGFREYGVTGDIMNCQIILHESSNIVELSYGSHTYGSGQGSWEVLEQVGLTGTSIADYNLRATSWSASTTGVSNGDNIPYNSGSFPANGLNYKWSPLSGLPIELLSFTGENIGSAGNKLTWKVATQTNNDRFIIERSVDATNWEEITSIPGAGNTSQEIDYNFVDVHPYWITYYKLTQYDYDGHSQSFDIVCVTNAKVASVSVRPNPVETSVTIEIGLQSDQIYKVEIVNAEGLQVYTKEIQGSIGINSFLMDTSTLSSGFYSIKIESSTFFYNGVFIRK